MISTNDFKTGVTVEIDGEVFAVVDFQHVKPGKGSAFVRSKLKNVKTGAVVERTFNAGEKMARAHLDRREMQYLYSDGDAFNFMDNQSYDQISITREQLGDAIKYLKENTNVSVLMYQGSLIGIDLPNQVELEVTATDPGIKGDTASGGSKPATVETGAVVQVPFFVEVGDVLLIDTRTGNYIKRV
ncbi:elongation factor P [Phosphitispora fastidiosa]|uniref:elongation factor P n=1 Tax=Phosphitispora fastidiosa TaxID=2837202 RepID=UPI001E58755B|nr:elongation factor P [Phosphitispora fastidiosa]MBU7007624.1 elongation factor P [Phosphitispora fastidiosa]